MKFEIYKDKRGEWRWRLKSSNGKIIAMSSEGYKRKQSIKRILIYLHNNIKIADIEMVK